MSQVFLVKRDCFKGYMKLFYLYQFVLNTFHCKLCLGLLTHYASYRKFYYYAGKHFYFFIYFLFIYFEKFSALVADLTDAQIT